MSLGERQEIAGCGDFTASGGPLLELICCPDPL
jgi:hypothetical protein